MTRKLYDENAYATSFSAEVLSCLENEDHTYDLILDQTLFFPEEGGQTCDQGFISMENETIPLMDVQISDGVIHHKISVYISEGARVRGEIDWNHRFSNMQNHTGEHIFSGLVNKRYGYNNVGFHLSDSQVTMDYDGALTIEQVEEIEAEVNEMIYQSIPVQCEYPSKEELSRIDYRSKKEIDGDVRIVTIEGVDACACCAPHVRTTAEVGILKVVSAQNYKGGTRLSILCGRRAFALMKDYQKELTRLSQGLKVPKLETADAVEKLFAEREELRQEIGEKSMLLLDQQIAVLPEDTEDAYLFTSAADVNLLRRKLNELSEARTGYSGFFWPEGDGYRYMIAASKVPGSFATDANLPNKNLREQLNARGGGKPEMVQGSVTGTESEILTALHKR